MTHSQENLPDSVVIRLAGAEDRRVVEHLAALDSVRPPAHPILLAERDGQAVAAVALTDGVAVANPFLPTADVVELLRIRARQVQPSSTTDGRLRATASGETVGHTRNWLHRLLERPYVSVQGLHRDQ